MQVFTGDGRGKTSAAIGTAVRALGYGLRVMVIFFMKNEHSSGEYEALRKLGATVACFGRESFVDPANVSKEDIATARQALIAARQAMFLSNFDLIVLDEVNVAAAFRLIDLDDLLRLIDDKPPQVELILTGRQAPEEIVKRADLVTDMVKVKHPYDSGMVAREGLDY